MRAEVNVDIAEPSGQTVTISVVPSGVIHWQYEAATTDLWGLAVMPVGWLWNLIGHHLIWRRGWLLEMSIEERTIWKRHFFARRRAIRASRSLFDGCE